MMIKEIAKGKIRRLKNHWYSLFGDKNYKKFVIVTSGRYGSNLLVSFLDSHENVEANIVVRANDTVIAIEIHFTESRSRRISTGLVAEFIDECITDDRQIILGGTVQYPIGFGR